MIFSPSIAAETPGDCEAVCCTAAKQAVGDAGIRLSELADAELDRAIRELGQAATDALFNGQPDTAREFTRRMYAAIQSRTPEHQARLHEAVEARIADECSFAGNWTQEVMRRRIG